MSQLDELLNTDAENVGNSRQALANFHPDLPKSLDSASEMFDVFTESVIAALDISPDSTEFEVCAKELGIDSDALLALVESEIHNPTVDRARAAFARARARMARGIVFLLLQRQFMWAATDLLRMRLMAVLGYGRQQTESLALLILMRDDPVIATRWLRITTDEDGRQFYQAFQRRIREQIDRLDLGGAYEQGSGAALHVRLASGVRSLSLDRIPHEIRLGYQDVRSDDPFSYYLDILFFFRTQERILRALVNAFPEVTDPKWLDRTRVFTETVDHLWGHLVKTFPEESEKYRKMAEGH